MLDNKSRYIICLFEISFIRSSLEGIPSNYSSENQLISSQEFPFLSLVNKIHNIEYKSKF